MKKIAFILSIFFLVSCGKGKGSHSNVKQQISLKANGVSFSVTTSGDKSIDSNYASIIREGKFQLNAEKSNKKFSMSKQGMLTTGIYEMGHNAFDGAQWTDNREVYTSILCPKSHMQLNVTKITGNSSDFVRYIEGTFSGVLYDLMSRDSVRITEGQIKIID